MLAQTPADGAGTDDVRTEHRFLEGDARDMCALAAGTVDLIVTSPPYPMIAMWDARFSAMDGDVGDALRQGDGATAFRLMHTELDRTWAECARVLRPGGIACINVGDATRSLGDGFRLWPNHARIIDGMARAGFTTLPDILWRKPTNAPNKFLGSGMLPAGAYVTYEHEYILVFRRGGPRVFATAAERAARRRSAFFFEERNVWFSDVWTDLRGTRQFLGDPAERTRSAAFPFELPWRLIHMFSVQGDLVLDPFAGTGTTLVAAAAAARGSVGIELDGGLRAAGLRALGEAPAIGSERIAARIAGHTAFVASRMAAGRPPKHRSSRYGFPVVTGQEKDIRLLRPVSATHRAPDRVVAEHREVDLSARGDASDAAPLGPAGAMHGNDAPKETCDLFGTEV